MTAPSDGDLRKQYLANPSTYEGEPDRLQNDTLHNEQARYLAIAGDLLSMLVRSVGTRRSIGSLSQTLGE